MMCFSAQLSNYGRARNGAPTMAMLLSPADIERCKEQLGSIKATALKQCLPLGLVCAIVFGLAAPVVGTAIASLRVGRYGVVDSLCVWFIFFVSGLTLKTDEVLQAIGAWRAITFALTSILFITPLISPLVYRLPPPFLPEFALGFALFTAMPTTINTGVALSTQALGSFALALVITVSTNLLGVFTVPFFLSAVLRLATANGALRIDAVPLLLKLLVLILVPLVAGKTTRELSARARAFAAAHKQPLSLGSNGCIVLIAFLKLSESAKSLAAAGALALFLVLLLALAIHALYLGFNLLGCRLLRLPDAQLRSVVIMASQKTLPMAMAVLAALPPELGEPGLIAIPCIVSHLSQIFVDAFIATRWASIPLREPAAAAAAAAHDVLQLRGAGGVGGGALARLDEAHALEEEEDEDDNDDERGAGGRAGMGSRTPSALRDGAARDKAAADARSDDRLLSRGGIAAIRSDDPSEAVAGSSSDDHAHVSYV